MIGDNGDMKFSDGSLIGEGDGDVINFILVVFLDIDFHSSLSCDNISGVFFTLSLLLLFSNFLEFTYHLIISTKEAPFYLYH